MNYDENTDPWLEGQAETKSDGWPSKLMFVLFVVPFRIVFGILGQVFGAFAVLDNGNSSEDQKSSIPEYDQDYNWNGTINTDGDITSGK